MTKPPAPPYVGPGKDSGGGNKPIRRIVIHSTVGPSKPGSARNIAAYFRSSAAGGSAHYIIDAAETLQSVWDSRIAWHAPPNSHSLGIELCDWPGDSEGKKRPASRWNKGDHAKILQRAAELTAQLCLAYDVPIRKVGPAGLRAGRKGICGHVDVRGAWGQTSHWDPGHFPWRKFIRMCRAEARKIRGDKPAPKPAPKPTPTPTPKPTPEETDFMAALDEPLNTHDPKGRAETQSVTVREALTASVINITSGRRAAKRYLAQARKSKA